MYAEVNADSDKFTTWYLRRMVENPVKGPYCKMLVDVEHQI